MCQKGVSREEVGDVSPASPGSMIPEDTLRAAHAVFPEGNMVMRMRDAPRPLYADLQFAAGQTAGSFASQGLLNGALTWWRYRKVSR
jgi:hypothetical protein